MRVAIIGPFDATPEMREFAISLAAEEILRGNTLMLADDTPTDEGIIKFCEEQVIPYVLMLPERRMSRYGCKVGEGLWVGKTDAKRDDELVAQSDKVYILVNGKTDKRIAELRDFAQVRGVLAEVCLFRATQTVERHKQLGL